MALLVQESFFTAQRRHRRAARVLAALTVPGAVLQSVLVAAFLAPTTFFAATLVLDVVNLWRPAPDLIARWDTDPGGVAALVIGGNLVLVVALWLPVRLMLRAGLGAAALTRTALTRTARAPDPLDPAERRLLDVVAEISLAAGIQEPRVVLVAERGANVAVFGDVRGNATLIVPRSLLDRLDRRRLAAVVAYQAASIAHGDLRIFNAVVSLPVVWALARRLMVRPFARRHLALWWHVARHAVGRRDPAGEAWLWVRVIGDEMDDDIEHPNLLIAVVATMTGVGWMVLRLFGEALVVGPYVVLLLGRRRLLADAAAVQLTRDPEAVADALAELALAGAGMPASDVVDIACVVPPRGGRLPSGEGPMGTLALRMHPATARRLRRLRALGAGQVDDALLARVQDVEGGMPPARGWKSVLGWIVFPPLMLVLAVLLIGIGGFLLLYVLGMFYVLPVGGVVWVLHQVLR